MPDKTSPKDRLVALLKPSVEPLVKSRLREEIRNMPFFDNLRISVTMFCFNILVKYAWIREWLANKDFRKNPPPFFEPKPPHEIEEIDADDIYIRSTLNTIVCFWMQALVLSAENRKKLILTNLDDAMFPINQPPIFKDKNIAQLLDEQCAALVISAKDVRDILRAIKQSLPASQVLPEAMIDYLKSAGVTVE